MTLSRYQLQRTDLTVEVEQGRRVEIDQWQEMHRGIRTMGELLKARAFGATPHAIGMRKRMTQHVQGGGATASPNARERSRPPEPHPDLDAEGPRRRSHLDLVVEPLIGRLKVPARYRKDESDR